MIRKTFIVTFVLFIIQNILIWVLNPQNIVSQHVWQNNRIKAQEYIYDSPDKEVVIVGSSLSGRLIGDLLPDNVFNLSFSGSSVYDGIQIIKKSNSKPKIILLEGNFIDRGPRQSFINEIFTPVLFSLRYYFPGLRQKFQPVNLLSITSAYNFFNCLLGKYNDKDLRNSIKKIFHIQKNILDQKKGTKKFIEIAIERNQEIPDTIKLKKRLKGLYAGLNTLSNNGTKIVFFEIPMHPEICISPRNKYLKNVLRTTFSPKKFLYFADQKCVGYETTDGWHLNKDSALLYTEIFVEELSKVQFGY